MTKEKLKNTTKRRKLFWFIFAGLLILLATYIVIKRQKKELREASIEDLKPTDADRFAYDDMDFEIGNSRKQIINKLGKPNKILKREVANSHNPDETDHLYEFFYDGLYVRIYRVKKTREEFVTDISATSEEYRLRCGLGIGSQRMDVENVLGKPTQKSKGIYTYEALGTIKFFFRNDTVKKIEKIMYVD